MEFQNLEYQTVASFEAAPMAWVYRNRLAEFGMEPIVTDEYTVNIYWLYSNAIGGVKVQVPKSQMSQHNDFHEWTSRTGTGRGPESENQRTISPTEQKCSHCESIEISVSPLSKRWVFLILLFIGIPIPVYSRSITCYDCGARDGAPSTFSRPFDIIYLILLATFVALVLGLSIQLGATCLDYLAAPNRL